MTTPEVTTAKKRFKDFLFLLLVVLGTSVVFGVVLWICWTHDLHLEVYSDDVYWYREEFPTSVKVIVTVVISLVLGLFVGLCVALKRWCTRHDSNVRPRDS
jgi:ABC-type proline/glycine betaine transport system permease subunit